MACFSPSNDHDEKIDAILEGARQALEFVGGVSDVIPVPGLSTVVNILSSIIGGIQVCYHVSFYVPLTG